MNASYEWLREFAHFDLTPEQLRDLLTARVATVDDVVRLREDLSEVVIGRVVEVARHPNSDHLWVTKVDAGRGELIDVVCGAPNVEQGRIYPFAPAGSTLPGGLKLEKRKIRGAISEGMLCSARELGLGADHEGILALDVDAAPGTKFLDAMPVGDVRLVIDVNPNRPDLLSHEGVAREIAAALGAELKTPDIRGNRESKDAPRPDSPPIEIDDQEGCPRYMGCVIKGVKIAPSPAWLASKIEAIGGRSINNVVDATNYMLHGFGQPMHAFDLARLNGGRIVVRRARAGEKIRTLDGVDRTLDEEMTVIADASRAQAIAGVIGGEGSEVSDSTTDILLEVAAFNPRCIRATRRKLNVSTDASYHFERGVDAHAIDRNMKFAVDLIVGVAGGSASDPTDVSIDLPKPAPIKVRGERIAMLLGERIDSSEVETQLRSIGFSVKTENHGSLFTVIPPTFRSDVVGEIEVIEEVARLHGYDKFPDDIRPFRPSAVPDAALYHTTNRVAAACVAEGLLEVRPLPFTKSNSESSLRVLNPLAEDEAFLRQEILDTLARRAEFNLARMQRNIRLFETGAVFARGKAKGELPNERLHTAALIMGARRPAHFTEPHPPNYDEWDVKGIAESITQAAFPGHAVSTESTEGDILWAIKIGNTPVGDVRRISLDAPAWAAPAFGFEIDLQALGASVIATREPGATAGPAPSRKSFRPIPAMPAMEVDLALIVPDSLRAADVERVIRASAGELMENLVLFDEFRGAGIPEGARSLAWALTFRHPERTLRDREVQGRTERILKSLESELGVRQRTG
jgi:phenylalanyl-tRNA synthetase beta chain